MSRSASRTAIGARRPARPSVATSSGASNTTATMSVTSPKTRSRCPLDCWAGPLALPATPISTKAMIRKITPAGAVQRCTGLGGLGRPASAATTGIRVTARAGLIAAR
ncbi:MAG TPA: hypothetical protein VGH27_25120 [Streptosporangiaceae bacterium]|jgi:hypothetical protein